jgi:predicted DNA-binding transcriptional regulator AlpA
MLGVSRATVYRYFSDGVSLPVLTVLASRASTNTITARRMKADGHSGKDVAKYLGVSRATLYRYLADDNYRDWSAATSRSPIRKSPPDTSGRFGFSIFLVPLFN